MKRLAILGSTGSVGRQALDVVRSFPDELEVVALCAGQNGALLDEQLAEFQPRYFHHNCGSILRNRSGSQLVPFDEVASLPDVDVLVVATVGHIGLKPTLAALKAGKSVALANKEVMIMAGGEVMAAAADSGAAILPVDSEPSAIWQCIAGETIAPRRLIITASGGAFRDLLEVDLVNVTPDEALRHPTWSMGRKITVDSATLMNKAFEVIEARWLFDIPYTDIDVVIHRQSIVHSMVEFVDGAVKAQLGPPDMRYPIQYALFHPERRANASLPRFDPLQTSQLTFEPMDPAIYPCFRLAIDVAVRGGTWPAVLAGADEAAVGMFLEGRIRFTDVAGVIEETLADHSPVIAPDIDDILDAEAWAADRALRLANVPR